jgi:hypothetical protein
MKVSVFSPYVFIADDGTIDVDFFDVYSHTHDNVTLSDEFFTETAERHGEIFNEALGWPEKLSAAEKLRKLADYIDAHPVESPVNP